MRTRLITSVVYGWTWLHGMHARVAFRRRTARCRDVQRRVLDDKLRRAAETEYGRRYGFARVKTPDEYRRALPVMEYEALAPWVERVVRGEENVLFPRGERLIMFAMTSGTTAAPKYVPVTERYFRELARGNFEWGVHLLADHPSVLTHSILHIVSPSREGETEIGVPCGAATGLVAESQRKIAHLKYALPTAVYGIGDHAAKYYTIVRMAMERKISLLIAANPSTLVALGSCLERHADRLLKDLHDGSLDVGGDLDPAILRTVARRITRMPGRAAELERIRARAGRLLPKEVWPEIESIGCWTGGTLTPYLPLVREYWGERPLRDPGLIASEGRMTIPLEDGEAGGVLDIGSHFYEFIPFEEEGGDETLLAHELEKGRKYFILLTTSSGFFRYNISDVVEVAGFYGDTPILRFLHKGSRISSLTGEKLSEYQVVEAFRACERGMGFAVPLFTVCPCWGNPPHYLILLEERCGAAWGARGPEAEDLAASFDGELKRINMEYRSKRESGRLAAPVVRLVEEGAFERDKQAHILKSGGRMEQYKHPYLSPNLDHCARFRPAESPR
ncbi:MAG: GH3 auxin-responsive promoter family protein [Candidatus Aureabacteria bacterium]|nr:GH3 auxin-responsive promoter family protein [Candidatus Auribacterota bacterium]